MAGQMTALLIGDAAFCEGLAARGLGSLGLATLTAADVDAAALPAAGVSGKDIHVVLLDQTGGDDDAANADAANADAGDAGAGEGWEQRLTRRLRAARSLPFANPVPVITIGPGAGAAAIRAGAFHHLAADCDGDLLTAAVSAAIDSARRSRQLGAELRARAEALGMLTSGTFRFRTPDKAADLAMALSSIAPNPQRVALGLLELMLNAVEHGNLAIGSAEKSRLRAEGRFAAEVERRLHLPAYRGKWASLHVLNEPGRLTFTIADAGAGFDWRNRDSGSPSGEPVLHGRGILLARTFGFDRVQYEGCGNRVIAVTEWDEDGLQK